MTAVIATEVHSEDTTLALWRRYRRQGDGAARTELLERHLPLVRLLARKLSARLGGVVEVDDLVSAGTIGLVQALESYDLSRANTFATYASRRVHGAMLDELRRRDWVPRSVRVKARKIHQATGKIESVLGRRPAPREMAAVLQIDLPTYWSWQSAVDGSAQIPIDESPVQDMAGTGEPRDTLDGIAREERVEILADALTRLPERERLVLVLYFYEELNLRQIATMLGLTESRISQIRTAAFARLRGMLVADVA